MATVCSAGIKIRWLYLTILVIKNVTSSFSLDNSLQNVISSQCLVFCHNHFISTCFHEGKLFHSHVLEAIALPICLADIEWQIVTFGMQWFSSNTFRLLPLGTPMSGSVSAITVIEDGFWRMLCALFFFFCSTVAMHSFKGSKARGRFWPTPTEDGKHFASALAHGFMPLIEVLSEMALAQ